MAHLRRRPKSLPIDERITYTCELVCCPACGTALQPCRHLSWTKTVQHLDRVVVVSSRPKQCPNPRCADAGRRYPSATAQTVALPKATYGLDVLAQIGFWRDHDHLNGSAIYERLRSRVQISRRHVDLLTQQYRLLLACAHRPDPALLSQVVHRYGGLIISLDGLEPEGAQEQLWVVREVVSGAILAVGWLPRVNASTLGTLLAPLIEQLQQAAWPVLATLSDKQHVVVKALQQAWPDVPHQWCQAHYLRNLATPIHDHDHALLVDLRRDIRQAMRASLGELASSADAGAFSPSGAERTSRAAAGGRGAPSGDAAECPARLRPSCADLSEPHQPQPLRSDRVAGLYGCASAGAVTGTLSEPAGGPHVACVACAPARVPEPLSGCLWGGGGGAELDRGDSAGAGRGWAAERAESRSGC